jgi:hypothetical protein
VVPILRVVEIVGITALTDRVRSLFGRDDDDPQHVVFFVGPPRSARDIADELEREQAAAEPRRKRRTGMPAKWGGPLPPDDPIFHEGLIFAFGRPSAPVKQDDEHDDDSDPEQAED